MFGAMVEIILFDGRQRVAHDTRDFPEVDTPPRGEGAPRMSQDVRRDPRIRRTPHESFESFSD